MKEIQIFTVRLTSWLLNSWPGENSNLSIISLSGNLVINLKPGFLNSSAIDILDRIHFWLWGLFLCIVEYSTYISGLYMMDASSTTTTPYSVGKTTHSPNIAKFSLWGSCSRLKTTGLNEEDSSPGQCSPRGYKFNSWPDILWTYNNYLSIICFVHIIFTFVICLFSFL